MTKERRIEYVETSKLVLDKNNPRFAELYSWSGKEEDLISYLLFNESADDIAKSLSEKDEFYTDRPLWVIKQWESYLVKDWNRRCAAAKALENPGNFGLSFKVTNFKQLPVIVYEDLNELEMRISEEHAAPLFREWERIAKALQAHKLHSTGTSEEALKEMDSSPGDLIRLACFYYEAVKIWWDSLKKLLRRGRGKTWGKTIIFERLFKYKSDCGYGFKNKPDYSLYLTDSSAFSKYILGIVWYLEANPKTTHSEVDDDPSGFLKKIPWYPFLSPIPKQWALAIDLGDTNSIPAAQHSKITVEIGGTEEEVQTLDRDGVKILKTTPSIIPKQAVSVQVIPHTSRKGIPPNVWKRIEECFRLDSNNFANSKTAMVRIVFECTLKYVLGNTMYNGKSLSEYRHFSEAYNEMTRGGILQKRTFINFDILKTKFSELIKARDKKKAFESFDLDDINQIIHNYNVVSLPKDSKGIVDNLLPLLEFMLQDQEDFLSSLDLTKL